MKKFAFSAIASALIFIGFVGCELEPDCKDCYIVTYSPEGKVENKTFAGEFCDEKLEEYEGKASTDPSGVRTVYECE